ncbi:Ryanodine receptor 2 [Varanus komodoensis]|nr:Ryanodine receptor 2 [Varanus komodoensis]
MNSHQSGLRFLPPPFHHPGWRSHAHHEFLSQKMGPSCLYASRRKDHESSCLEFGTEKCPPGVQPEVPALPGLEIKDPAFPVLQSGPPQPAFPCSSLPQPSLTIFPPPTPCQELTSAAPNGNLHGRSPPSSPSDFAEKRDYEMSILLKPNYGLGERKGEEEEAAAEEKNFLQKAPSLDLPKNDKTSPALITLGGMNVKLKHRELPTVKEVRVIMPRNGTKERNKTLTTTSVGFTSEWT